MSSSMLTCGTWVRRGIAKEVPDRIELTKEDLDKILEDTRGKIKDVDEDADLSKLDAEHKEALEANLQPGVRDEEIEGSPEVNEVNDVSKKVNGINDDSEEEDAAITAEYGLEDYDNEGIMMSGAGMAGLMYFAGEEEDPYVDIKQLEADEREDLVIKKDDNMFVVGKMEEDCSCLEVYIYNESEDNLYVHHDIVLESFPLCLEWLSYDPALDGQSGNYVALGTMEPNIEIWDLDVVDTLEPVFVLEGKKKKKKKKDKGTNSGHTDAVLGLSWNKNVKNVIASGSADETVCLWDMSAGKCVHRLNHHKDKVQCVCWHPYEAQSLLTGSFDKYVSVVDCRSPESGKKWLLPSDCEQTIWDHLSPFNFFASTDGGVVSYYDVRTDSPVFTLNAHDDSVVLTLSSEIKGCLVTASADNFLKVWDVSEKPTCVLSRDMKMGRIHFVAACPDAPFLFAAGGEKDGLRMLDLMETAAGKEHFSNVKSTRVHANNNETEESNTSPMETDTAAVAMASLQLETEATGHNKTGISKKLKKKKKKRKEEE